MGAAATPGSHLISALPFAEEKYWVWPRVLQLLCLCFQYKKKQHFDQVHYGPRLLGCQKLFASFLSLLTSEQKAKRSSAALTWMWGSLQCWTPERVSWYDLMTSVFWERWGCLDIFLPFTKSTSNCGGKAASLAGRTLFSGTSAVSCAAQRICYIFVKPDWLKHPFCSSVAHWTHIICDFWAVSHSGAIRNYAVTVFLLWLCMLNLGHEVQTVSSRLIRSTFWKPYRHYRHSHTF